MNLDIQKANLLKRMSAFLLDFILMTIAVTGFAFLLSVITPYQKNLDIVQEKTAACDKALQELLNTEEVDTFNLDEVLNEMFPEGEENQTYKDAKAIFTTLSEDPEYLRAYTLSFYLTLIVGTFSFLFAHLLLEVIIPLILKNGQTVGKKIFGIGVMHVNGMRIKGFAVFTRGILGKFTIECMAPLLILVTVMFGGGGIVGLIVLVLILGLEAFVFFKDKSFMFIHDTMSQTVAVDLASQMIFDTPEELLAYKKALAAEVASIHDDQPAFTLEHGDDASTNT